MKRIDAIAAMAVVATASWALVTSQIALADDKEIPFGAAVIIIELTDSDIELQVFDDAFDWKRLEIFDPKERKIFEAGARGRLRRQGGMSEMFWASEPSHYLVDEPEFDEPIEAFLKRWPPGVYDFEGWTGTGVEIDGEATLSHVLPALPEILSPVSDTDETPVVNPDDVLVIDGEPVTTRFGQAGALSVCAVRHCAACMTETFMVLHWAV